MKQKYKQMKHLLYKNTPFHRYFSSVKLYLYDVKTILFATSDQAFMVYIQIQCNKANKININS